MQTNFDSLLYMGNGKRRKLNSNSSCYYDTGMTVVITDENSNENHILSLQYMNINNRHQYVVYYSKTGSVYYRDDGEEITSLEEENIQSEDDLYSNYTEY